MCLTIELRHIWAEHIDADGDRVPVSKVVDIFWNVGYILGNEYSKKFVEELTNTYGKRNTNELFILCNCMSLFKPIIDIIC